MSQSAKTPLDSAIRFRITPHSCADSFGRQAFTMQWPGHAPNGKPIQRGQVFHASIREKVVDLEHRGHSVVVEALSP